MSNSKVKIAAVGLGNRTCKYLRYVAERQDVAELVAVVDTDETARLTAIDCLNVVILGDENTIEVKYKDGSSPEVYDFKWTRSLELHAGADPHSRLRIIC